MSKTIMTVKIVVARRDESNQTVLIKLDLNLQFQNQIGPPAGEDVVAEEDGVDEEDCSKHCDSSHKSNLGQISNQKINEEITFLFMSGDQEKVKINAT